MKKEPMEWRKLSLEQIKEAICSLQTCILDLSNKYRGRIELKQSEIDILIGRIHECNIFVNKLKEHFFPENYTILKVSINEMADMMLNIDEKISDNIEKRRREEQSNG